MKRISKGWKMPDEVWEFFEGSPDKVDTVFSAHGVGAPEVLAEPVSQFEPCLRCLDLSHFL